MTKRDRKEYMKEYREKNKERIKEYGKKHYEENKERIKEYREKNKERIKEYGKKHYEENKERIRKRKKEYYENNKEQIKERSKKYRENNKEHVKEFKKQYTAQQPAAIYKITNTETGTIYIGQTTKYLHRWTNHRYQLRHNKHDNKQLQEDCNTFGKEAFVFEVIEELPCDISQDVLLKKESEQIKKHLKEGKEIYNCLN